MGYMTSELSFLIELLLKHKLPPATKDLIAGRIKDVEAAYQQPVTYTPKGPSNHVVSGVQQAPSTLAIMARNPDLVQPVAIVAQTPAAAAALADRQNAIAAAMSGKPEKGQTSPRKFHANK